MTKVKLLAESWRKPKYDERTGRLSGYNRYRKGNVIEMTDEEAEMYLGVRNMGGRPLFGKNEETENSRASSDTTASSTRNVPDSGTKKIIDSKDK